MDSQATFHDLIHRVRAGDEQAAAELMRRYEPVVRLEVRMGLTDLRLRRLCDSLDICQDVLASFFVRAAMGQYELDQPRQLLQLLVAMARHKLASEARKQWRKRRDSRRLAASDTVLQNAADSWSPDRIAAGKELLHEFQRRLSPDEWQLAQLRIQGCSWADIAQQLGGTSQARRKQLTRALDRVSHDLGLDGVPDG